MIQSPRLAVALVALLSALGLGALPAPPTVLGQEPGRSHPLFNGKAHCATCHPAPFYTDHQMHDLRVEDFYRGRAEGWVKTFSLRGIKDSPPYLHDGRAETLEEIFEKHNSLEKHGSYQVLTPEERAALLRYVKEL